MSGENRRRSKVNEFGDHKVTFTVTIAKAFPTDENEMKPSTRGLAGIKGRRRVYEAPKPQFYYHLEYKLLPDESEPLRTDVVTYGVAAKVYIESDSKILKTWVEGKKTWIAWTHSHTITITKDVLLKLYDHTLELRIWDSKDRVSPRARFDRPKAFRLPVSRGPEDQEDPMGVRQMVAKQLASFDSLQPKPSVVFPGDLDGDGHPLSPSRLLDKKEKGTRTQRPSTFHSTAVSLSETASATGGASMVQVQVRVDERNTPQFSRMAYLAGVSPPITAEELKEIELSRAAKRESVSRKKSHAFDDEGQPKPAKKNSKQPSKKELAAAAHARLYGTACVSIKMSHFFAGTKSITNRIEKSAGNIEDLLVSVSLSEQLLSEIQKKILNPMVINVTSASGLPNRPLSFKKLRDKCKPVYLSYQFYKQPRHESAGREHGREVYWQDVNVVLLGTLDKAALAEFLQGPHFEVELHDRDRKVDNKKPKPCLFGENMDDDMINSVSLVAGRRTTHNPFEGRENPWDPYGVAKFDLSGLLLGQRVLHLRSPVHCCPLPDTNAGHEKPSGPIVGRPGNVDGPEEAPLPSANYLEAGSELKVKFELAYPLNALENNMADTEKAELWNRECPFGRIVYIFEYSNAKFLRQLQAEITSINAEALKLDSLPVQVIEAALSTYKLSAEQRKSKSQDIITGFQVLDGRFHMFVLEGLVAKGIKRLWTNLPRPQEEDPLKFNVLYNSDMFFHERLYASLDVDLCRVRLHEPLTTIMQNPLLYVRDLVPKPCFEALAKLDKLLNVVKLRDATRGDLFPSAEMVISMSREFGVPLTAEDFGELESEPAGEAGHLEADGNLLDARPGTSRVWTPLELRNPAYVKLLKERKGRENTQDFIRENILRTRTTELKQRPHTIAMDVSDLHAKAAHNYSIQSLNSTELAKEKLRHVLSKDDDKRFTYCPQYNSATVLPVHPDTVKKRDLLDSQAKWRTTNGFVYPGKKTSLESNIHQKKPDSARVDELRKPWKENVLHANVLKPTVPREQFPWPLRHQDLDLLSRPPPYFDKDRITSVHAAGDTKDQETLDAIRQATAEWRDKLVVDDSIFRTHRCLTETELQPRGRQASNQLDKLKGLLKNEPQKYALGSPGFVLSDVPALTVVLDPSLDTASRKARPLFPLASVKDRCEGEKNCGFYPGPYDSEGWLLEKNKVPIHDREHGRFEELKGKDFGLFYKKTDLLSRRPIEPLTAPERETHLFAAFADTCS